MIELASFCNAIRNHVSCVHGLILLFLSKKTEMKIESQAKEFFSIITDIPYDIIFLLIIGKIKYLFVNEYKIGTRKISYFFYFFRFIFGKDDSIETRTESAEIKSTYCTTPKERKKEDS